MSIYSIMAFNNAVGQYNNQTDHAQQVAANKAKLDAAQEELDTNKKLDIAKVKDARNQGIMSDYIGDALEKHINEQYKPKMDILDLTSSKMDKQEHDAQNKAQQAQGIATQLHQSDPDVQSHVATLSAIMNANSQGGQQGSAQGAPLPTVGGQAGAQGPQPNAAIPSIFPQLSKENIGNEGMSGMTPQQPNQSPQATDAQVRQPSPQEGAAQPQPSPAPQPAPQANPSANNWQSGGALDLSPMEQAFGMPKGSLWLNPSSMKPELSPVYKANMEAHQRAQAAYDVNQPFREEQRQDRIVKQASDYLAKQVSARSGGLGQQDQKVNAAIHARQLIDQSYDPNTGEYNVSQVPYGELSESVGNLLSGGGGTSEGRINALKQRVMQGDINSVLTYFSGKPSNATSQDAIKQLVGIIDRQGQVSEDLRDKYVQGIKKLPLFSRLDPDTYESIQQSAGLGNSFKEYLKNSPDQGQVESETNKPTAKSNANGQKDYSHLWNQKAQ